MNEISKKITQYSFTILAIYMPVKFPCKICIQHNGISLTSLISSNSTNKFIFNQEITLHEDTDRQYIELQADLISQKGGKYIAGVIRIKKSQLLTSVGQSIVIPFIKCLDNQSFCQIKVNNNLSSQVIRNYHSPKRKTKQALYSPQKSTIYLPQSPILGHQAKSELYLQYSRNNSPNSRFRHERYKSELSNGHTSNIAEIISRDLDHEKLIEAEVYKQCYGQLKEKYRKQASVAQLQLNKRIGLQNNENNLKLTIMKLSLKVQQQQKNVNQKNHKIKELQNQVSNFQKHQLEFIRIKQDFSMKQHHIRMLEESMKVVMKEFQQFKTKSNEKILNNKVIIQQLKTQSFHCKQKLQNVILELQKSLKSKEQQLKIKQSDYNMKIELLNRQKNSLIDLEKSAKLKIVELEKMLFNQRNLAKTKHDDLKLKIEKLSQENISHSKQKQLIEQQLEKNKSFLLKIQYELKFIHQEKDTKDKQLNEIKHYKQKYIESQRQLKIVIDDRNYQQKQLQKMLQSKQLNWSEISKQNQEKVQYFRSLNKQLEQKSKNLITKMSELEAEIEIKKTNQQKQLNIKESLNKQITELKEKERSLKRMLSTKQNETETLKNILQNCKQKYQENEYRLTKQIQQLREETTNNKIYLEDQIFKNNQLKERNNQLMSQFSQMKVKLQFTEEKISRQCLQLNEKNKQFSFQIQQLQKQILSLNSSLNQSKKNQKQQIQKFQTLEIEKIKNQSIIQRGQRQILILQEKIKQFQQGLRQKMLQNNSLQKKNKDLQKNISQIQQKNFSLKSQLSQFVIERTKNKKIIQTMQSQNDKYKHQIQKIKRKLEDKEQIQQLHAEISKNKQQNNKIKIKLTCLTDQHQRFIQNTFDSIKNIFSDFINTTKKYLSISSAIQKIKINQSYTQIPQLLSMFLKDIKNAVIKLGEQKRQFETQLIQSCSKNSVFQNDVKRQIKQNQSDYIQLNNQRQKQSFESNNKIRILNIQIKEKDKQIFSLKQQIAQLQFSMSSLKCQYQARGHEKQKKMQQSKNYRKQLELNIEESTLQIDFLKKQVNEFSKLNKTFETQLRKEKEKNSKLQKMNIEFGQKITKSDRILQQSKEKNQQLFKQKQQLQIQLRFESEEKEKYANSLNIRQMKGQELKSIINNLTKQKEQFGKSQREKNEKISKMQSKIKQLNLQNQNISSQRQRLNTQLEDQKASNRKISMNLRQIEVKLSQQKIKNKTLALEVKDRQNQLIKREQNYKAIQSQNNRLSQNNKNKIHDIGEELKQKTNLVNQINQQCAQLMKQKVRLKSFIESLNESQKQSNLQFQRLKKINETHSSSKSILQQEISKLRQKISETTKQNQKLKQQISEKQSVIIELKATIGFYNSQLQSRKDQNLQNLKINEENWIQKYEGMYEQCQQRFKLVEKEKNYFKSRFQQEQEKQKNLLSQNNRLQIEEKKLKNLLEVNTKKYEEQKSQLIKQKLIDHNKLSQQLKNQVELNKQKDTENKRLIHELEVARSTILKMDHKIKDNDEKNKSLNKVYQSQIQKFSQKQSNYYQLKEGISAMQWNSQRQIKTLLLLFNKRILELCSVENQQAMMDAIRTLQQSIINSIKINLK